MLLQLLRRNPSGTPSTATGAPAAALVVQEQVLPFAPVVISRLCLALAAVAVRAANGVEAYVREAFALSQVRCDSLLFVPVLVGVYTFHPVSGSLWPDRKFARENI